MPSTLVRLDASQRDLVEQNVALVEHITQRVHARYGRHIEREELVHVGMLGLVEAAARFDASRHPVFHIRRAENRGRDHRLPAQGRLAAARSRAFEQRVARAEKALFERLGRAPTRVELAQSLDITGKALENHQARVAIATIESLDRDVPRG